MDSRFQVPDSSICQYNLDSGFWTPIVSGIPDTLNCIPDSKTKDSVFQKQKFPGLRNPDSLT